MFPDFTHQQCPEAQPELPAPAFQNETLKPPLRKLFEVCKLNGNIWLYYWVKNSMVLFFFYL